METIEKAALFPPNPSHGYISVPRPGRHHNVIQGMVEWGYTSADIAQSVQGFVTSTGRFVDRFEAYRIATAAGQIKEKTYPLDKLFSEDIW